MRSMVSTPPPHFTFTYLILLCTYIYYEYSVSTYILYIHAHTTVGTYEHAQETSVSH